MRMWMVPPQIMCRKHLLGEHVETHMLAGCIRKGKSIKGFLEPITIVEPKSLRRRHDELAMEMKRRGYNHASELQEFQPFVSDLKVSRGASYEKLMRRCQECRKIAANAA